MAGIWGSSRLLVMRFLYRLLVIPALGACCMFSAPRIDYRFSRARLAPDACFPALNINCLFFPRLGSGLMFLALSFDNLRFPSLKRLHVNALSIDYLLLLLFFFLALSNDY